MEEIALRFRLLALSAREPGRGDTLITLELDENLLVAIVEEYSRQTGTDANTVPNITDHVAEAFGHFMRNGIDAYLTDTHERKGEWLRSLPTEDFN